MNLRSTVVLLAFFGFACSGPEPAKIFLTDVIQIRQVIDDDPLAAKVFTAEGEEMRVGDVILADKLIQRVQLKGIAEDRWDLLVVLGQSGGLAKWRNVSRRLNGKTAALLIDGKVLKTFPIATAEETEAEYLTITIDTIVSTKGEAEQLQLRLDAKRSPKDK
jgi:hypothetical protein